MRHPKNLPGMSETFPILSDTSKSQSIRISTQYSKRNIPTHAQIPQIYPAHHGRFAFDVSNSERHYSEKLKYLKPLVITKSTTGVFMCRAMALVKLR